MAVFRGQVERIKNRKKLNSSSFWHTQISTVFYHFEFFAWKMFFFELCILLQVPVSKWPGKTKIFNPISEFIEKSIFQVPQNIDFTSLFLIFHNLPCLLKTAANWVLINLQQCLTTLKNPQSQGKKIEHELGHWEYSRCPKNNGKWEALMFIARQCTYNLNPTLCNVKLKHL